MESVGYSKGYSKNPKILKGTETFQELLKIYLPKSKTVRRHGELQDHCSIEHYVFPKITKTKRETELTDGDIKKIVESVPGCTLIYIKRDNYAGKIAFYQSPDGRIRKDAVDMAYKLY
jgi:hypothetical protein